MVQPEEEIIGKTLQELYGEVADRMAPLYRRALNGESVLEEMQFPEGYYIIAVEPVRDEEGNVIAGVITTQNITERKHIEDHINELNDHLMAQAHELKAVNRELEAFSYSVSHDLRAPLRSIDGFSLALLEDYGEVLDATAKDYLNRVRAASQRMASLIDDMLTLSRITRRDVQKEPTNLSAIVEEIINTLRETNPQRQIEANIAPEIIASCDPQLIHIVMDNLLGNAWKFTSKREVTRIEFNYKQNKDGTIYYIKDNGTGFDMQFVDKLFMAFQRLQTDFEGSGIGLATVQRVINKHGGKIWAEGEPDKGATFYFSL